MNSSVEGIMENENTEINQELSKKRDLPVFTESMETDCHEISTVDVTNANPNQINSQEQPVIMDSKKENTKKSPILGINEKNDNIALSKTDDFSLNRSEIPSESVIDNDDELVLHYEDDMDDDIDEIINEDALLEDNTDVEDNIIPIQETGKTSKGIHENKKEESLNNDILKKHDLSVVEKMERNTDDELILGDDSLEFGNNINKSCDGFINILHNSSKIESALDTSFEPIKEHGLNKPDVMLEIPTQELIEFSDDDDYETMCLEMSPDVDDVINSEDISFTADATDLDDKINCDIDNTEIISSIDMIISVTADANTEVCSKTVPVITTDTNIPNDQNSQNDNNTNELSYEAEIAAKIITKEMNAMNNGTTTVIEERETSVKEDLLAESELNLKLIEDKEICMNVISCTAIDKLTQPNINVIEILDDTKADNTKINLNVQEENLEISLDINEYDTSLIETDLSNQDAKEQELKLAILEDDILNEAREIDNLILATEICKPNNDDLKEMIDSSTPFMVKTCKADISLDNTEPNTIANNSSDEKENTTDNNSLRATIIKEIIEEPIIPEDELNQNNSSTSHNNPQICQHNTTHDVTSEANVADVLLAVQSENDILQYPMSENNLDILAKPKLSISETLEINNLEQSTSEIDPGVIKSDDPKSSSSTLGEKITKMDDPTPSTSKTELTMPQVITPKPSTSESITNIVESNPDIVKNQMLDISSIQESSNDVPEMTDSLGLLAESSRVMEDDEEHDYDDYGEDEDDFDDESSNQMTAEHSEDSNTHQSEPDLKDSETPKTEKESFDFTTISDVVAVSTEKIEYVDQCKEKVEESKTTPVNESLDKEKTINEIETMDVGTVKLSDTSDTVNVNKKEKDSLLKSLLLEDTQIKPTESVKQSWSKTRNLSISKQQNILSFVDLEESSSDEEKKDLEQNVPLEPTKEPDATININEDVTNLDEPTEISDDTETVNIESPTFTPVMDVQDDQSSVEAPSQDQALPPKTQRKSLSGLVFNLDSDDDEASTEKQTIEDTVIEQIIDDQLKLDETVKCINRSCTSKGTVGYYIASTSTAIFFEVDKKKRAYVCEKCSEIVEKRNQELVEGIKNFKPLYELHTGRSAEELVEISDSESDEEPEPDPGQLQRVGEEGAKFLEDKLANQINDIWDKFKMDSRLNEYKMELQKEMDKMQKESEEINSKLDECQMETDKLRNSLYATFETDVQELPPIIVYDMPGCNYSCLEVPSTERRQTKRRLSPSKESTEIPAKKSTAAGACKITDQEVKSPAIDKSDDDNTDISVVKLSVEAAPPDLPPPGELSHPPIKVGMTVYAMKNAYGAWLRAKVVEIQPKSHATPFTICRVRFEHKVNKNPMKTLAARYLSYFEPPEVRMTIGTRVIALFKDISSRNAYYSGIVAEIPNPVNNYRYLIFFDDGYAQYAPHSQTRLVCECSSLVWEEVHPYSREFVRGYLLAYPERPMVRLHTGQNLKTEWRGKWWSSKVVNVDASLVEVQFLRCDRREWIYRGSTRLAPLYLELQAAERHRPRALPRTQPQSRTNMPYVEYTRSDEQADKQSEEQQQRQQQNEEIRRQRAVAKKSTVSTQPPPQPPAANLDNLTSRVVYYTPKNAVKPYKMTPHVCSVKCKRSDVLSLKDLRTYNPLAKPLLSGWERQIVRWKGNKDVMYVAPCGRRLRNMKELHRYLRATESDMPVDLFDFSPNTHCLAEFVLNKCFIGKKDLSHGKENVQVPCVNYYDESLPEFCSYNTERTPTAGVPLNLDPEFLCGCDCEDDCVDKTKCGCWKMTLEGARTIGYEGDVGYVYRRLPEPLPSGIYECNSRCKCKNTCLNRVAQHPLQLKLQVFKTLNRGWGIRALNDVPKGAFLCVYAGNLLTDATANLDGLNEGDEYLAELDYIEVVEQMKEGYEEDIPDKIKALDKKQLEQKLFDGEDEDESSEEDDSSAKNEKEDDDFQPGFIGLGVATFSKRLRRRDSKKESDETKQEKEKEMEKEKESNPDEECITISDDEEVREPSCFTAAAGMGANEFVSKYRSVRTLFGEDEACYIMDAKVQGNIGRYLNHSCAPNVFVQNVFVDTHDPRFPWVAFFALHPIRAGTELTWNYNYDVGSVPGKVLYCFCGAQNCRGRLL